MKRVMTVCVVCVAVLVLAGCEGGGSTTFTWNDAMQSGLPSLGYMAANVTGSACTPAPINGGDGVNFDQCLVAFVDGTQIHIGKSGGSWRKW